VRSFWAWLSAFALTISNSVRANDFPDAYTPEPTWPSWPFARVEGRSFSYLATHFPEYSYKFYRKKFSAPREEIAHFERQRALQHALQKVTSTYSDGPSIAFLGDVMWIGKSWNSFLSPQLLSHINSHDFVFGNLESPVALSKPVSKPSPVRFVFNSPPELVTSFKRGNGKNSFTALSVINNHTLDQGESGLSETMQFLLSQGVHYSGATQSLIEKPYTVVERNGIRIGFYALGFGVNNRRDKNTTALLNILPGLAPDDELSVDVKKAKSVLESMRAEKVDLKIVSLHWGFEFEYFPHPHQMAVARELIRSGADILMGHHSHVQQPNEVCFVNGAEKDLPGDVADLAENSGCLLSDSTDIPRRALVMYSLGNFSTAMETFLCQLGLVNSVHVARDENGKVHWSMPRSQFVFNARSAPPSNNHLLLLWEDYLRQNCFRSECRPKDLAQFTRVKALQ
jgi:poly-gamma-glutamate capsule biosynthesis protein CapA/YwtB (metallophosphatase superfamily)